jgi:hypothetical protein
LTLSVADFDTPRPVAVIVTFIAALTLNVAIAAGSLKQRRYSSRGVAQPGSAPALGEADGIPTALSALVDFQYFQ